MLDISLKFEVKKIEYPIMFTNNTCVACGGEGTLKFVDIFGKRTSQEIHPLERLQCARCGANYGIHWEPDMNGNLNPTPTDYGADVMFSNLLNHLKIKKRGNKILQE